jgi:hypothetical protein
MEALVLYSDLGDQWLPAVAWLRSGLAALALKRGKWIAAQTHVVESLTIGRDIDQRGVPELEGAPLPLALEVQALLAAVQGAPWRAIRLAGAAAALRTQIHQPLPAPEQVRFEEILSRAREQLSAEEQALAWTEGQGMTPEQAISDALESAAFDVRSGSKI